MCAAFCRGDAAVAVSATRGAGPCITDLSYVSKSSHTSFIYFNIFAQLSVDYRLRRNETSRFTKFWRKTCIMSQSTPPARGIPVFYRLFFTWLDPIICLWGAYLDFFAPRTVLSSHILNDTPDIGHIMILKQRGGNMLNFGFISAFLLRYTSDLKIWHIIEIGLLITDFAYFPAVFGAMNAQHRVLPETWRGEDWGSLVVTGFATLVRLAFCARVGFSGEEDSMETKVKKSR